MIIFDTEMPSCCMRCLVSNACPYNIRSYDRRSSKCPCVIELSDYQDKLESALFEYGQHDKKFKLGEMIKYSLAEYCDITRRLSRRIIERMKRNEQV